MSWRATRASAIDGNRPRKVAVIDLGSNSWRLVIFSYGHDPRSERDQGWWKHTDELYEAVRIGEGIDGSGELSATAIARGIETLTVFARFCQAHALDPTDIHVFATSAIRDATNQHEFLERVRQATGYEVEILSARQEAHYGYVAAINSSTVTDGVVLDIGGGSMQLVRVANRQEADAVSFPVGAVRMTERFLSGGDPKRPVRKKDVQQLQRHIRRLLAKQAPWIEHRQGRLVATGGAVRNLAAAAQRAEFGATGGIDIGVQGYVLTPATLSTLVKTLSALPIAQRRTVPGIKPGRGDIILAAALTLQTVLATGEFDGIEVTEAGLRDGIFLARTILGEERPLFDDVRRTAVVNLAIQYEDDLPHVEHVAKLALELHASLAASNAFTPQPREAQLLWAAAMLHDVGMTISYDDHHKHSRYLIVSAELPGFDPRERALIAQMARYHRKGVPKLGEWAKLGRPGDEQMLERCAMLLRLAEHLERGRDQSVSGAHLQTNGDGVSLHLLADGDLTLPRWSVERYGDDEAFARVFGRPLVIG